MTKTFAHNSDFVKTDWSSKKALKEVLVTSYLTSLRLFVHDLTLNKFKTIVTPEKHCCSSLTFQIIAICVHGFSKAQVFEAVSVDKVWMVGSWSLQNIINLGVFSIEEIFVVRLGQFFFTIMEV